VGGEQMAQGHCVGATGLAAEGGAAWDAANCSSAKRFAIFTRCLRTYFEVPCWR
jgi:hypothetical protein